MTTMPCDPLRRPGLAYQHAFDWLAVQLQAAGGPVAARAPASFHAVELLRRLPDLRLLPPLPPGLEEAAAVLGLTVTAAEQPAQERWQAIAWPEPPLAAELVSLTTSLRAGGRLYLVAPGPLGRFLAERREDGLPASMSARAAIRALRAAGWAVRRRAGLHGPRAIAWHYAGQAAGGFGRVHRQDRCHFAMRRDFVETGLSARPVALILIEAEKPA